MITATTAPKETVEKQKIIFVSTWLFPNFRLHTALDFVIASIYLKLCKFSFEIKESNSLRVMPPALF
jgi:hypothetical protein